MPTPGEPRLPVPPPVWAATAVTAGAAPGPAVPVGVDPGLVRPYTVTGGRTETRGADDLPLEALCSTTDRAADVDLRFEKAHVALLCRDVQSIAEVAARLRLPLGVARVLVADLRDEGLLDVHLPLRTDGRPSAALLERVLDGLRAV